MKTKVKKNTKNKISRKKNIKSHIRREIKVQKSEVKEYEKIVEFSYNEKQDCFVIRFLDGSLYVLKTENLPQKIKKNKPDWTATYLKNNQSGLIVVSGKEKREIEPYVIHTRGLPL